MTCPICNEPRKIAPNRQKLKTCGKKECLAKLRGNLNKNHPWRKHKST